MKSNTKIFFVVLGMLVAAVCLFVIDSFVFFGAKTVGLPEVVHVVIHEDTKNKQKPLPTPPTPFKIGAAGDTAE